MTVIKKHKPSTASFIEDIVKLGRIYGFVTDVEYHPTEKIGISCDIVFKLSNEAVPVIIFEVESQKNPNMVHNVTKIFTTKTKDVKKPWFFFHIVYSGNSGQFKLDFSLVKDYTMYNLFENVRLEKNRKAFLLKLDSDIRNIFNGLASESAWKRYKEQESTIIDPVIKRVLKELLIYAWGLPAQLNEMVEANKLSLEMVKKLRQVKDIMIVSPAEYVNKMILFIANQAVNSNWSSAMLDEKIDDFHFLYIRNRSLMHNLNLEHNRNMASTGHCYCLDLKRKFYQDQGMTEKEVNDALKSASKWANEDHVSTVCRFGESNEKSKVYDVITIVYGIHPQDLRRLEINKDETIWLLMKDNKWKTTDKGLCWNCGEKPIALIMENFYYCYDCAVQILKDRKELYKP